jgi:hypothetical protein
MDTNKHELKLDKPSLVSIGVHSWFYSIVHNTACLCLEERPVWGQTVCRVWLPNQDAVVRVPRSALRPLSADLQPEIEAGRIACVASASKGGVPQQIHAYLPPNWKVRRNLPKDAPSLAAKARDCWYVPDLNKAGDLEKLREKALLKEFEEYKQAKKKLKIFRPEAVRTGFKKAWQGRDYATIVAIANKIPTTVLKEDTKLLMWYDQAVTRLGGE